MNAAPTHTNAATAREAARQQALVALLFAPQAAVGAPTALGVQQSGGRWRDGLAAYRGNGREHARVALRAQFPTVLAMLGEEAFDAVAARHWLARPPRRGDLAWMGEDFADTLAAQEELHPWPWLADSARLDWALWDLQRQLQPALEPADLQRLAALPPDTLRLRLAPGALLLTSDWPIVTLWEQHRAPVPDAQACSDALQQGGQTAWVWRAGWQANAVALPYTTARWMQALQTLPTLEHALQAVEDAFDLAAWLQQAVQQGWIDAVDALPHSPG